MPTLRQSLLLLVTSIGLIWGKSCRNITNILTFLPGLTRFLTIATRKYGTATNPSPAPLLGSQITPPLCSSQPTDNDRKKRFFGQFNAGVLNQLPLSRTALKQQIGRCSVLQRMGTLTNTQTLSLHISSNASMSSSLGSVLGLSQTKSPG